MFRGWVVGFTDRPGLFFGSAPPAGQIAVAVAVEALAVIEKMRAADAHGYARVVGIIEVEWLGLDSFRDGPPCDGVRDHIPERFRRTGSRFPVTFVQRGVGLFRGRRARRRGGGCGSRRFPFRIAVFLIVFFKGMLLQAVFSSETTTRSIFRFTYGIIAAVAGRR